MPDSQENRTPGKIRGFHTIRRLREEGFFWKILVIVVTGLGLLLLWAASDIFLLAFAGSLAGIFVNGLVRQVRKFLPLSHKWAYLVVVVLLLLIVGGVGWWMAPRIGDQIDQLQNDLPQTVRQLQAQARQYPWAVHLIQGIQQKGISAERMFGLVPNVLTSTVGAFGSLLLVLFIGLYVAFDPKLYQTGILHLIPLEKRAGASKVLDQVGNTIWRWTVGRLVGMTVVGVLTGLGLWWLDVPLSLALSILAALLDLIPNIGPIIAAVPAILLALTQQPVDALYVILLYVLVQNAEAYFIEPFIEKYAVSLPPALTMVAQMLFYVLFGLLGLLLAMPITAALYTAIRMIYVRDILGDHSIKVENSG